MTRFDLRPGSLARTGHRILYLLASTAAAEVLPAGSGVASWLAQRWAPGRAHAPALLNTAMVLCVDDGPTPATAATASVALNGAPLYAAVSAGLGAFQGAGSAAALAGLAALFRERELAHDEERILGERLRHGEGLPGFGDRRFAQGDPRARLLLDCLHKASPEAPGAALSESLARRVAQHLSEQPTLDYALAAVCWALDLGPDAALWLCMLGRVVGWIGHAIQCYAGRGPATS